MKELEYPFDSEYILKKKKSLKRELLAQDTVFLKKKRKKFAFSGQKGWRFSCIYAKIQCGMLCLHTVEELT